jgi:hypothetical protein
MAKTKFDIKTLELPAVAAKPLYVGVGATDLAVEYVREAVADVQKRFVGVQKDVQTRVADVQKNVKDFDFEPKTLREQAVTVVNDRVDALAKDAKARRAAVEARVAELQADAKARAAKVQTTVQTTVNGNVASVTDTYAELAKRGETTVKRLRGEAAGTLDEVADTVDAPKTKEAKKSAARTTTKKAPAKKSAAKKTTAKKSAAK